MSPEEQELQRTLETLATLRIIKAPHSGEERRQVETLMQQMLQKLGLFLNAKGDVVDDFLMDTGQQLHVVFGIRLKKGG